MHTYVPDQQQQSGSTSAVSGFLLASGSHAPVSVLCLYESWHGWDWNNVVPDPAIWAANS